MLREALEFLRENLIHKRAAVLELGDGSRRRMLYSDAADAYAELPLYLPRVERRVSNVESFAAMVKEEARRAGLADSDDEVELASRAAGHWMTVVFTPDGGVFHLDDRDPRTSFRFERALSPQWERVTGAPGKGGSHTEFLRLLQSLRPSIVEYPAVMAAFRKVALDKSIKMESAPQLKRGETGTSYALTLKVDGRDVNAALPDQIRMVLPVTRGSAKTYELEVEVLVELREHGASAQAVFGLVVPDALVVAEQAIADEVAWFRDQVKGLPQLSILEDY